MTPETRSTEDDMFDNSVTGARARHAGRLIGDEFDDDEATAVAEESDDDGYDDAFESSEEAAMHLTTPPPFDDSDGYIED
jgi:hypothetical protein